MTKNSLILFKQDLRIIDNEAFFTAVKNSQNLLPLFILDEANCRKIGEASKWFLHFALEGLAKELEDKYSLKLVTKKGDSLAILEEIFKSKKIEALYFNKLIEPFEIKLQAQIIKLAETHGIEVFFFQSQTLFDPLEIKNGSGNFYKVFTPFWKECLKKSYLIQPTLKTPQPPLTGGLNHRVSSPVKGGWGVLKSDDLDLLPKINWDKNFKKIWQFNHQKLRQDFTKFLKENLPKYKQARDFPALNATSKLSPYLHFGMISIREVFNLAITFEESEGKKQFIAELCWREFSHHLLFHFPNLPTQNFNAKFDKMPWFESAEILQKWQRGETGFPIVDAGMKELWTTGCMHNRVRMIVASFLIKDLLIDWREGEKWFWNCLVDANLANNSASWQWVAGSGLDAAPYFRIFNPTTQSERFDSDGIYIKKWLPQLKNLPKEFIHQPSKADEKTLKSFGVELGKNYPKPMLDHKKAREMALMIYKNLN